MTFPFQLNRGRALICIFSMAAVFLPSANLHAEVILPGGLPVVSQYQLIFVTAETRDATSADIADYNTFVTQKAALSPGLPSGVTWKAVASTSTTDACDNAAAYDNIPIYNTRGQLVADGKHLWDSDLLHGIDYNQYGDDESDVFVWTGSEVNGTKKNGYGGIIGPLGSGAPYIGFGSKTFTNYKWIDRGALLDKSEPHSFYALSGIIPEPGALMLLGTGTIAFAAYLLHRRKLAAGGIGC